MRNFNRLKSFLPYTREEKRASEIEKAIMLHGLGTKKCRLEIARIIDSYR